MDKFKETVTKPEINFWITLLSPLIAFIVAFTLMRAGITENAKDIADLREDFEQREMNCDEFHKQQEAALMDIRVRLAEVQKDIIYIKEKVDNSY